MAGYFYAFIIICWFWRGLWFFIIIISLLPEDLGLPCLWLAEAPEQSVKCNLFDI